MLPWTVFSTAYFGRALHYVAKGGYVEIVELLLANGASTLVRVDGVCVVLWCGDVARRSCLLCPRPAPSFSCACDACICPVLLDTWVLVDGDPEPRNLKQAAHR